MAERKTPLERIAEEMAQEIELSEKDIAGYIESLMDHLRRRAADAIIKDDKDPEALRVSNQYWVFAAMVEQFGSSLVAFDDLLEEQGEDGIILVPEPKAGFN